MTQRTDGPPRRNGAKSRLELAVELATSLLEATPNAAFGPPTRSDRAPAVEARREDGSDALPKPNDGDAPDAEPSDASAGQAERGPHPEMATPPVDVSTAAARDGQEVGPEAPRVVEAPSDPPATEVAEPDAVPVANPEPSVAPDGAAERGEPDPKRLPETEGEGEPEAAPRVEGKPVSEDQPAEDASLDFRPTDAADLDAVPPATPEPPVTPNVAVECEEPDPERMPEAAGPGEPETVPQFEGEPASENSSAEEASPDLQRAEAAESDVAPLGNPKSSIAPDGGAEREESDLKRLPEAEGAGEPETVPQFEGKPASEDRPAGDASPDPGPAEVADLDAVPPGTPELLVSPNVAVERGESDPERKPETSGPGEFEPTPQFEEEPASEDSSAEEASPDFQRAEAAESSAAPLGNPDPSAALDGAAEREEPDPERMPGAEGAGEPEPAPHVEGEPASEDPAVAEYGSPDPRPADAAGSDAAAGGMSDVAHASGEAAESGPHPSPEAEPGGAAEAAPESAASPSPSRWDAPVGAPVPERRTARREAGEGALSSALRVIVLVGVAGGALYAGLLAIRQDGAEPVVTVRAPRVVETRSVPLQIGPAPRPLRVEGFRTLRDLDLRGELSRFVRWVPEAPAEVCRSLSRAGWTPQDWGASPLGDMSECLAERSYGDGDGASGFAVLRGRDTLSEIRIKLNLADDAARETAAREMGALVAGLFERWHWDGGKALGDRIAVLEPFQDELLGTTVRLMREHGEVERWNLALRFPVPPPPREASDQERALAAKGAAGDPRPSGDEP